MKGITAAQRPEMLGDVVVLSAHAELEAFAPAELPVVGAVLEEAAEAVRTLIAHGLARAMNRYNVQVPAGGAPACETHPGEGR